MENLSNVILWIMAISMLIGGIDRLIGNKYGLGEKFENGIVAMGITAFSIIGIISLAPVLAIILTPIITPFYTIFGADPAMFAGSFLAIDMGAVQLAENMTENQDIIYLSAYIVGSMLGATIVFDIPVGLGIISKESRPYLAKGLLIGMITIPFGAFAGGIVTGIPMDILIINLMPVFVFAMLITIGLMFIPKLMIRGFIIFGRIMTSIVIIGTMISIFNLLTGFGSETWLIQTMTPIEESWMIAGYIGAYLAGAFVFIEILFRILRRPVGAISDKLGMNEKSTLGILMTTANDLPTYAIYDEMDNRGKIINAAFIVPAAFMIGDHLAFTAANDPFMIFPVMFSKMTAGIIALLIAFLVTRNMTENEELL